MTVLRLVRDDDPAEIRPESLRAPDLTPEELSDLEWMTLTVLGPADLGCAELRHAIINRDRTSALAACRRLLAVGLVAGDRARQIEREG